MTYIKRFQDDEHINESPGIELPNYVQNREVEAFFYSFEKQVRTAISLGAGDDSPLEIVLTPHEWRMYVGVQQYYDHQLKPNAIEHVNRDYGLPVTFRKQVNDESTSQEKA